jgi:hypothetical protein
LCVFSERTAGERQLVFWAFDPVRGRGRELAKGQLSGSGPADILIRYGWDLSPDGSHLAFAPSGEGRGHLQILALPGGEAREINVKGWNGLSHLFWAADGKGLFASANGGLGATLLYVDLGGSAQVVWRERLPAFNAEARGIPSPNGRYLAVSGRTVERNVWLLENF